MGFLIYLWLIGAVVVGMIAVSRARNGFVWCLLALLFSPLLMCVLVLALGRALDESTHRHCDQCREIICIDARKCRHCGSDVPLMSA